MASNDSRLSRRLLAQPSRQPSIVAELKVVRRRYAHPAMNGKETSPFRHPAILRAGRYFALFIVAYFAVTHSTRLLGLVVLAAAALLALPLWRWRRVVALAGFLLLCAAELLPFDISLIRVPGPPRLVPYPPGMHEGRPVALGLDGQLHFTDHPGAVCVLIPLFPNPPQYVVVW